MPPAAGRTPIRVSAALNLANLFVGMATGIVLTIVAARSWDQAVYGRYIYLGWLAGTIGLWGAAAFPALAVRLVAESIGRGETGRARRLLLRIAALEALSISVVLGGAFVFDLATGALHARGAWLAVAAVALLQPLATLLMLGAQGAHRFELVLLASLPTSALAAVIAAAFAAHGAGPVRVLLVLAAGYLALTAVLTFALARVLQPGRDGGGPTLAEVRPYFLLVSALAFIDVVVWQKSEVFFLQRFADASELALYGTAFTLSVAAVRMAPAALGGVLMPAFAGHAGRGATRETAALFRRGAAVTAALSVFLALLAIGLGRTLLSLWGPRFVGAWPLLPWLLAGLVCGNVSGIASAVFHGYGRADLLVKMGLVLATVNIALDLLLIPGSGPVHGAAGAAIACACAQALSLPAAALLVGRAFPVRYPVLALLRVGTAGGLGALASVWARGATPAIGIGRDLVATGAAIGAAALTYLVLGGTRDLLAAVEVLDPPPPVEAPGAAPPVTVVVPTKNRPEHLRRCLERVIAQDGPEREVIVVDSSDDTPTELLLASTFPQVRRVRVRGMPNNRHFAKNQGIRLARGSVICFLDDDSFAEPGWLGRIVSHYADPAVGAVGGRIVDAVFGPAPAGAPVGTTEANGRMHLNFTADPGKPVEVAHLIGCNLSFRAAALATVGGFDLHYGGPNFMEETDLCLRVGRAGFRLLFDPDAVVTHVNAPRDGGMERRALDPQVEFWSARSRAYLALKLLPRTLAVLRYNFLGQLKLHARAAVGERSLAHLRALGLQAAGSLLGVLDWVRAGFPRVPPVNG